MVARASHPVLRTIGLAIRELRRERGLSQEALAGLADIDRSYMSGVERGLRNISILNVARIAAALDVPVWELFLPPPTPASSTLAAAAADAADALAAEWEPRYLSLG